MAAPRVLLDEAEVRKVHLPASPDFGWRLFGILGGAFVLFFFTATASPPSGA